jgi:hypothetical protein
MATAPSIWMIHTSEPDPVMVMVSAVVSAQAPACVYKPGARTPSLIASVQLVPPVMAPRASYAISMSWSTDGTSEAGTSVM